MWLLLLLLLLMLLLFLLSVVVSVVTSSQRYFVDPVLSLCPRNTQCALTRLHLQAYATEKDVVL